LLFIDSHTKYIKEVLIITIQDLKKKKSTLKGIIGLYSISKCKGAKRLQGRSKGII
jgi:hypothetical protein